MVLGLGDINRLIQKGYGATATCGSVENAAVRHELCMDGPGRFVVDPGSVESPSFPLFGS